MPSVNHVREGKAITSTGSVDSVTLARLMDEVRNKAEFSPNAYNRMHNRHNR